jgi:hypothetical protein
MDSNEYAMCIDHCRISIAFYSSATSASAVINMGPDTFKVSASCLTTPPILITFLTTTCIVSHEMPEF